MDEREALKKLKRQDEQALEWFIDHYAAYVHTILYNIIGSSLSGSDLEEAAADVFLTLWVNASRVSPGKAKAYLGGVARNKAKEYMRKAGKEILLEEDVILLSEEGQDPAHRLEAREQAQCIRQAVESMGEPEREIFFRYYYFYQPVAAIAEQLGLNPSTVKVKLHRGRIKLKNILIEGGFHIDT